MVNLKTPKAEVEINEDLVRRLLQSQHPDLANLPIQLVGAGWDNVMYRLGDDYAIRLPRRLMAVKLIQNEQKWLSLFAPNLPIPIPVPIRTGAPEFSYPWTWTIVEWVEGQTANIDVPSKGQGKVLAEFLLILHQIAPDNAPENDYRGVPLLERKEGLEEKLAYLKEKTNVISPGIEAQWQQALAAPLATKKCWIHGDLHARNVLVQDGIIKGIIDWGDMTSGDVATDLVVLWTLLDDIDERQSFIKTYQTSTNLLKRARGWAIYFATVLLANGLVDNPEHEAMGRAIFRRLEEEII